MKKILLVSLLVSSMFLNTACDNEDVALGVIAVGVGIGIAGMDDGPSHHDHDYDRERREQERREQDRREQDRWDRDRWERDRWDRDHRDHDGYRRFAAETEASSLLADFAAASPANVEFAAKHDISVEASTKIQHAFANVSKSGVASFQSIGLNEKALNKIMSREMPETAAIQSMSQELSLSEAKSRALLQSLVSEFDQQASNSQSAYWASCKAKGKWKTPQNAYCASTAWNGCSPETGATLCY